MLTPKSLPQVPVAPRHLPGVGHLPWILFDAYRFIDQAFARCGSVFWLHHLTGSWSVVVGGEPGIELFRRREVSAERGPVNVGFILDHTMLGVDGDDHRRMRGAVNRPFSPGGLSASEAGETVAEVVDARLATWVRRREVVLLAETGDVALDVIFRLMGVPTTDLPRWRERYRTLVLGALPSPFGLPGTPRWRALRARAWLDQRTRTFVDDVRARGITSTLLGAVAHGTDEDGRGLTEPELMANLRILALAGHETTASTLAWSLLYLGVDPSRWDRLVEEATGADRAPVTPGDLRGFPLAEAVFRESLRLHPPASMLRRTVAEPLVVHGVELPPGLLVSVSLYAHGRDEARYPEPHAFVPERWLDRPRRPGPAESFQFGAGPHFCLGYHLAVLEGVQFLVRAARALSAAGLRPHASTIPRPVYFPVVRPPARTRIELVPR